MFLKRTSGAQTVFNGYWVWPYLTIQIVIGKIIFKRWDKTHILVKILPSVTITSNEWLHFGIGISWLEVSFNIGISRAKYYKGMLEYKKYQEEA
jgi:hypothetical protein